MLFTQLETGGAQTRTFQTAGELRLRGHEVSVFSIYKARDCFEDESRTILADGKSAGQVVKAAIRFWRELRRVRYDVVICNTAPANLFGCLLALLAGVRVRLSWQTQPPQRLSSAVQALDHLWGRLGIYTRTVANSEWTRTCFAGRCPAYLARMRTVPDGIAARIEDRTRQEVRAELGIQPDVALIVTAGRLSRQKGHDTLIRAMSMISDARLLVLGDGELRDDLKALIDQHQLADRVRLVGEVPGPMVAAYLRATDVFAFPSRWETFGLAVIEAAANGIPLVTSDLDVLREVLLLPDGRLACRMAPVDQAEPLAAEIASVLSQPELAQTLSAMSLEVAKMHSLAKHVDRIETLIADSRSPGVRARRPRG
ncbi:MAG: glycosyltransferase family 4 protein [Rhodobacter sp.]|jgi:glycosyltransferase involved in cell wall biosynthesis|nr:glycosyltransferase family 4 protein [Rhodobacter sp.]